MVTIGSSLPVCFTIPDALAPDRAECHGTQALARNLTKQKFVGDGLNVTVPLERGSSIYVS